MNNPKAFLIESASLGLPVSLGSYISFLLSWVSLNIMLSQCPAAVNLFQVDLYPFEFPQWGALDGRVLLQHRAAGGPAPLTWKLSSGVGVLGKERPPSASHEEEQLGTASVTRGLGGVKACDSNVIDLLYLARFSRFSWRNVSQIVVWIYDPFLII